MRISGAIAVATFGIACYATGVIVGWITPEAHPTYHCDGSATMGYTVPGTSEAAACWIEGGEK